MGVAAEAGEEESKRLAKSMGASNGRVWFLDNGQKRFFVVDDPYVLTALTALDYVGYGLPAPTASWGEMIDQALQSSNRDKLWLSISPFAAITITLLLVTLIGESIREAFDPKHYARYE